MKRLLTLLVTLIVTFHYSNAQVSITSGGSPVVVDFQDWAGAGFANPPAAGQLSSLDWDFTNAFNQAYVYGGSNTTTDFLKGVTTGGVTSGGVYALAYGSNDTALWIQPTGSDFTDGSFDLVMVNNTGSDITGFSIAYDLLVLNDNDRGNTFNFSYSTDNVSYLPVPALDYTSDSTADANPTVTTVPMATSVSPVTVVNGGLLYLRWSGDDFSGFNSPRDEFGLDNINVVATTGTANPTVSFNILNSEVVEDTGSFMIEVTIDVSSPNPTSVDLAIDAASTAVFGSDFTGSPTTITFPANSTASQFITISIVDDNVAESVEQAILNLTNPTNSANIIFGTHTIDILDDDNILLEFVTSSASVSETGGTITAEVSIVNPNMLTTSVDVVYVSGTATSGTDFTYTNTTLTFPGGSSANQTVTITVNDDSDLEANETVVLQLANPTNGALYGTFPGDTFPPVFTGTILDDEVAPFGPCQNLFISEYIEGSSNNKAVEVYNPTDNTIDLSQYKIVRYNNGFTNGSTHGLSGMLAPGDVYVMGNSSADTAILNESDTTGGTVTFFNGNDALELYHFTTLIDLIGNVGQDSVWVVDTGTTGEHTIVRRPEVNSGNLDWTNSAANEWVAYDQNTFAFLGAHIADGCAPACPTPTGITTIITGPKKATLEWDDMPGALGYTVRGKRLDAGGVVTFTISNPTSQLKATGLTEGKSYWWEVRSICSSDGSVVSDYSQRDTFTLCGPPASYAVSNITQTTATLQWSAVANAVKYELLGKEASAPSSQIVTVAVNAPTTQLNATTLQAGKTYYWAVRSICNTAGTVISNIGAVQSFLTAPSAPSKTVISVDQASVYPNPASEILSVEVGTDFGVFDVVLHDLTGKEILRYNDVASSILNINVVDLAAGTYFIEVTGKSTFNTKVMIR